MDELDFQKLDTGCYGQRELLTSSLHFQQTDYIRAISITGNRWGDLSLRAHSPVTQSSSRTTRRTRPLCAYKTGQLALRETFPSTL